MSYSNAYVSGSAARKLNNTTVRTRQPQYESYVGKKQKKAISFGYIAMIVVAVSIMALVSIAYVTLQSDVTNLRSQKGKLASQYESLKLSNDLYYESIVSNVDLKEIERIAVEELGMKMAGPGQILMYSGEMDDYVKQYSDIPR